MVVHTEGVGGGTGPPSSEGTLPLPEQEPTSSGAQVKPSPQSEAVVQGKRYLGTHDRVVVAVQGSGVGAGFAHFSPGGQAGSATVVPAQLSVVCAKHTIPDAQSLSAVHGRGAHEEIVSGSHVGCVQVSPGAHAMAGQGVATSVT